MLFRSPACPQAAGATRSSAFYRTTGGVGEGFGLFAFGLRGTVVVVFFGGYLVGGLVVVVVGGFLVCPGVRPVVGGG